MTKHKPFNFKGSEQGKFLKAGSNYISKTLRLPYPTETLLTYTVNNKQEVCCDGAAKGLCPAGGHCSTCPVQGAFESTLLTLATWRNNSPQIFIENINFYLKGGED